MGLRIPGAFLEDVFAALLSLGADGNAPWSPADVPRLRQYSRAIPLLQRVNGDRSCSFLMVRLSPVFTQLLKT